VVLPTSTCEAPPLPCAFLVKSDLIHMADEFWSGLLNQGKESPVAQFDPRGCYTLTRCVQCLCILVT
jgi:hypothetical protein